MYNSPPKLASTLADASLQNPLPVVSRAGRNFAAFSVLLALAALSLRVDVPLARAVEVVDVPYDFRHFIRLGEAFGWGGSVAVILLAAAVLDRRGWRVVPRLAVTAFGAGLLADLCKLFVVRERPVIANLDVPVLDTILPRWPTFTLQSLHEDGLQSFPSGHVATATGLALALSTLYPRGKWLFILLAALTAAQRIEVQAHFLSDVLAGAAVGCLVGALCQIDFGLGHWFLKLERN